MNRQYLFKLIKQCVHLWFTNIWKHRLTPLNVDKSLFYSYSHITLNLVHTTKICIYKYVVAYHLYWKSFMQKCFNWRYVGGSKSSETRRISPQIYDGIIPNLYRVRNYHFLIFQCCQNDSVRSEVRDVIVWWRHATVTRSKKKTSEIVFSQRREITNIYVSCDSYFYEIIMDLT